MHLHTRNYIQRLIQLEHIMRDVCWRMVLLDILHSNGCIIFFICVYIHHFTWIYGLDHSYYPRTRLWHVGVVNIFSYDLLLHS